MPTGKPNQPASYWSVEQDKAQFALAVRRLKQVQDTGERLPLHFSLPTGRSIESLCDRVGQHQGQLPDDLLKTLHHLAAALSVPEPTVNSYAAYAPVLRAIQDRLVLPAGLRRRQ
jgi:hypothetical protein